MMTLVWLRVALVCYAAGLLYALVALTRTSEILGKVALHASYLGMVFHLGFADRSRRRKAANSLRPRCTTRNRCSPS